MMNQRPTQNGLTRRRVLQLSAAATTALGARLAFPGLASAAEPSSLYATLLRSWCDGLLAHQVTNLQDPSLDGALLCPACAMVHGRCADAIYPLLRVARSTGEARYLNAAILLYDWSERQVSRADGSWINDVTLSNWQGITVFHTIALAEALHHHGGLLDPATRQRWTDRLVRAAKFLDGFITIQTGNINYPITATYCFALCGQVLNEPHYTDRAKKLAHATLENFTVNGLIFGEGHPFDVVTPKGCHPVDLGYNVEESLPALALYSLLTKDKAVLDQTITSLRTHMEFMLPNGAWDNSWGTRNYKWSWWGSRTSDGCHPAYALLAGQEPAFREVAYRNLELMAACTHYGLLHGGPDYKLHGDQPCIHHTFTHAKALATVLDQTPAAKSNDLAAPSPRLTLPRDRPYGLKSFPEIATHLAAIGDWRASVTEYDWDYVETVQKSAGSSGGHVTGGALSLLYHRTLGPLCTASMTQYQLIEISNQQVHRDAPNMPLTPRVEVAVASGTSTKTYTSSSDFSAVLTVAPTPEITTFHALGRLLTADRKPIPTTGLHYHLTYNITPEVFEIVANTDAPAGSALPIHFILPLIARPDEAVSQPNPQTIRITKPTGTLLLRTDSPQGFAPIPPDNDPAARTFNLVPGFVCVPLTLALTPGKELRIQLSVATP